MSGQKTTTPFSDLYAKLLREFADQVGEQPSAYGGAQQNLREEIVRCLWFGSHFAPDELATDDGRRIEVLSPGWWNVEGGPDFLRAEFLLEGAGRVTADVEVHTHASLWRGHGHDKQPEYNNVALHVTMWNDAVGRDILLQSGKAVPQLTLSRFVEEEIGELIEIVDMEDSPSEDKRPAVTGRYCARAVAEGTLEPEWLGRFLDCAGDHRVLTKADRMERLIEKRPREQVLYEALSEALGYKNNRMPFLQLAGLLPLGSLRETIPADAPPDERRELLDAAFYGAGGFLSAGRDGEADEETAAYLERLRSRRGELPAALRKGGMSAGHWTFGGTRPVNYPTRRIAALSGLYAEHLGEGLFGHLARLVNGTSKAPRRRLDTCIRDALADLFTGLDHPYWSHRYTVGGKRTARARSLVGGERAASIIVDVLIPLLLAHARSSGEGELVERLHLLWQGLPARAPNAVVRRMEQMLFPSADVASEVVSSARRQQGLHQLYKDACSSRDGCGSCVLYLAHSAGRKLVEARAS